MGNNHSVSEMQARLVDLGYLKEKRPDGKSNIDNRFGETTLDAYNHYRATLGKGAVVKADEAEVERDLWPDEQPPPKPLSNPITDYLTQLAIKAVLANLKGRLPMLTGYKTYATAAVLAIMAIYSVVFGDLPLVGHVDPGSAIMALLASLGLSFARTGAKTEAAKATDQQ